MSKRRKHHKITKELPNELIEVVNKLLVNGTTYREIADFLQDKGHEISKSSVQRYGKDFLTRLERLRIVKEKARAIVEDNPDRPGTEMAEAASQMALQLVMEYLEQVPDMQHAKVTEVIKAIAQLERSAVAREKLKYEFSRGVNAAVAKIRTELPKAIQADAELTAKIDNLIQTIAEELR